MGLVKPIIVIGGEKESGKDSFADMLACELGRMLLPQTVRTPKLARFAFADPIKRALGEALGVPNAVLWGNSAAKEGAVVYDKSLRHWMQWYGTETFRDQVDPDVWVDAAIRAMIGVEGTTSYVDPRSDAFIISDCRFGNEYEKIRDVMELAKRPIPRGGYDEDEFVRGGLYRCFLFKVWRKNRPTAQADGHRSETSVRELDAFHPAIIDNSGTLEDLRERAHLEASLIFKSIAGTTFDPHNV